MRNRRPIKLAEYMQQLLAPDIKQQENWRCMCWRIGTLILKDKRVCRVSHLGNEDFDLSFCDQWYDSKIFRAAAATMEEGAHSLMKEIKDQEQL